MSPPQDTQPREAGKTTGLLKYYVLWFFIAWIGLWWICRERHESIIVYGGPFERHFREDLYYPQEKIEAWFKANIPTGSSKADADRILTPSFSRSLSSGSEVTVDSHSSMGGSPHLKIRLIFDSGGKFQGVKVTQHWAYL